MTQSLHAAVPEPVADTRLSVEAPAGIGEVRAGDDLAAILAAALPALVDGDVVVVASKVVSKAEGRVVPGTDRLASIAAETVREVARRGDTVIAQTRHGFVMAAAGVDASNVEPGTIVLLPLDPDASARALRTGLGRRSGTRIGVVVTDTFGRPWRFGQTDLAVGAAGVEPLVSLAGETDAYGNPLLVTAAAVADELAAAGDLVKGKLGGRPVALVRGAAHLVTEQDGPGVAAMIRLGPADMFALGSREAVAAAHDRSCAEDPVPAAGRAPLSPVDLGRLGDLVERTGIFDEVTVTDAGDVELAVRPDVLGLTAFEQGVRIGRASVLFAGDGFVLTGVPPTLRVVHSSA